MENAKYVTVYRGQMVACNSVADLNALLDGKASQPIKANSAAAQVAVQPDQLVVKIPTTFYDASKHPRQSHLSIKVDRSNLKNVKGMKLISVFDRKTKKWGTPFVTEFRGQPITEKQSTAGRILGDTFYGKHRINTATGPDAVVDYTAANFR